MSLVYLEKVEELEGNYLNFYIFKRKKNGLFQTSLSRKLEGNEDV